MLTQPEVLSSERHQDHAMFRLRVPKDLVYFPDHFPQAPILPGVVQTEWAVLFSVQAFGVSGASRKLEQIKFQHIIAPDYLIELRLNFDANKQRVSFSYDSEHGRHASGRIVFDPSH